MDNLTPEQLAVLSKEDQGPLTQSIIISFTVIAFVAVALRIFTRVRYVGVRLGWEDYVIVVSMIMSIVAAVFQILQAASGNGRHIMFLTSVQILNILKYLFWSVIFYNISICLTKVSILLQYGRIFTVPKMRIPLHIVMAFCVLWGISTIITSVYTCKPVPEDHKASGDKEAKCINTFTIWYVNASVNIFADLIVALLPVRAIWKLQIASRPKIALIAILSIGWFVCVVSVLRLHELTIVVAHANDTTYYSAAAAYWSSIEMNLSIVCASLPALKPLIVKVIPGFSSRGGSGGYALGTDGHTSKTKTMTNGVRSTARRADMDDIELAASGRSTMYPDKSSDDGILGKNIYVSRQFEQHYDDNSRISDSESQKDLVDRH